jgi:3-deoxy-D-manno-octulosonic-acid transferase
MSGLPASLAAYRIATGLAETLAPMLLRARVRRGKEDLARLGERLGRASLPRPDGPLAWLHGASVGEALSLLPLAQDLVQARPGLTVLITSGTRTAAELLAQRLPAHVLHQYAPVDGPAAARRFLDHWRPDLGAFVESELWPNLLIEAHSRRVPMALLSAKLSDSSLRNWGRLANAARTLFSTFSLVLAQDARSGERLSGLGIAVAGVADLKFGAGPLPVDDAALAAARAEIGARPVLLAASTHPGEDERILARFAALPHSASSEPLLVIVPRHPERGAAIAALAAVRGLTVSRQGAGEPIGGAQVRVADALGELGRWYRLANLAIVAGSLMGGVGGHNPLEPARLGCPFVSGPHVENWLSAYAGLIDHEATVLVATEALDDWLALAAGRAPRLCAMAERAMAQVTERDGQARTVARRLLALLP